MTHELCRHSRSAQGRVTPPENVGVGGGATPPAPPVIVGPASGSTNTMPPAPPAPGAPGPGLVLISAFAQVSASAPDTRASAAARFFDVMSAFLPIRPVRPIGRVRLFATGCAQGTRTRWWRGRGPNARGLRRDEHDG